MTLDFEKEKLISELRKRKPGKVLVQLAEGIKQNASELSAVMREAIPDLEIVFSGESCWGACSISVQEAEYLKVDLIVHFGHARFIDSDFPILYMEVRDNLDLGPILKRSLEKIKEYKKIGFSYSIQHRHDLEMIRKFFEDAGKEVVLSKKIGNVDYEGHIVGCQYEGLRKIQNEVECFVIMGNQFHSMGAAIAVEKPVVLIDVYNDDVRDMGNLRNKILKQRAISIGKLKDARKVGIIVEIKPGQQFGSANYLVKQFKEKTDKEVIVITMNELTPDKLMNFYDIDAFIELACPRIALDDFYKYKQPILTFKEALIALGIMTWEEGIETGLV